MCRTKSLLFTLIILLYCNVGLLKAQSTDSVIKIIRTKYQDILSNLKTYDTVTVEIWDESTEGGQAIGYYKKDKKRELKLIKENLFGETGKVEYEYYFDNGQLIFVFEKRYKYNRPSYWDKEHMKETNDTEVFDPKKSVIIENRYYFSKEKLIRWLNNEKKEVDLSNEKNIFIGQELIVEANKVRDLLKK